MTFKSLEEKLEHARSPLEMLRDSPTKRFRFDYPDIYTTWQDEQAGWAQTATLFDQSHHMTDVYFRGPDVDRLLAATGTNSFTTWGPDKAKHFVACAPDGNMIGTAVLFGLEQDHVNLVGPAAAANWVSYQAEVGGYDVEIIRDERTADQPAGGRRRTFRFEIEGPYVEKIVEKANGGPLPPRRFFSMIDFSLGGRPVRALVHTMAGVPGSESMGLEIFGPIEDREACWNALIDAGEEFGLVVGGALAYYTGAVEAGYAAQPTPAVYTDPALRGYRKWLSGSGYEAKLSIGGSYRGESIEDYYVTPYRFGYGHLVRFDHDFIGREALEKAVERPAHKRVWLRWRDEDVARVHASSLFGGHQRARFLETPLSREARVLVDEVRSGSGDLIGISTLRAYTVNIGAWVSTGFVDADAAVDGAEVVITWGEENGGTAKLTVERHVQTEIRATIHTEPVPHRRR